MSDDAFEVKPGDILANKFRIEHVLGIGGMGMVAAAWHLDLRTRVALKILLPSALADEDAVERFSREASAMSRMRSEYVVRVFDVGTLPDGGPPFLVMEHLEGEDLEAVLMKRGPLPIAEAVGHVLQACEGIAEAHSLGIIHRDLKPANLFLTRRRDGSALIKVVDFGIAKQRAGPTSTTLTGPMIAMGSPQYMSPEQTRASHGVDASTDIWSLGVVLYELLVGVAPFAAPSLAEVTALVLMAEPPSPEKRRADVPPALAEIVMKCLHKTSSKRFADVAALAEALEEFAPSSQRGAADRARVVILSGSSSGDSSRPRGSIDVASPELHTQLRPPKRQKVSRALAVSALAVVGLLVVTALWRGGTLRGAAAHAAASGDAPPVAASAMALTSEDPSIAIFPGPGLPPVPSGPRSVAPARSGLPGQAGQPPALSGKKRGRGIARSFPEAEPEPATAAATAAPAPPPATAAAPAVALPVALVAPVAPAAAAPAGPRTGVATGRVEIGTAINTTGTTAANVNRAIGPLGDRMTTCYRTALGQLTEPASGSGMLHIETDEDGVITVARVVGGVGGAGSCIAAAAPGRKVPNVDTGRARADIPLAFKAQ